MGLRRETEIRRATLTQEARVILGPEREVPEHSRLVRNVQILIPESPNVMLGLDVTPDAIGPNRTYKLPEMVPNTNIEFRLWPGQFIVAASAGPGNAFCALVIEYVDEDS